MFCAYFLSKTTPPWWPALFFFRHRRCWKSKRQIERHISSADLRRSDVLSIELEGKGIPVHFHRERGARTRCCGVCVWCFVFFIGREGSKDIECWHWRGWNVDSQELWYDMGVWMIGFIETLRCSGNGYDSLFVKTNSLIDSKQTLRILIMKVHLVSGFRGYQISFKDVSYMSDCFQGKINLLLFTCPSGQSQRGCPWVYTTKKPAGFWRLDVSTVNICVLPFRQMRDKQSKMLAACGFLSGFLRF